MSPDSFFRLNCFSLCATKTLVIYFFVPLENDNVKMNVHMEASQRISQFIVFAWVTGRGIHMLERQSRKVQIIGCC